MYWGFYGGRGRGFGGRGFGNPYPFCRFYPWLPRGWWRFGYAPYGMGYGGYGPFPYTRGSMMPYLQPPAYPYPPAW